MLNRKIYQGTARGGGMIEALVVILIISVGMISMLKMLTALITETGNARYRSQASLLANELITEMWTSDRSLQKLKDTFNGENAAGYSNFLGRVKKKLPGVTDQHNRPVIEIKDDKKIYIEIKWQSPGDRAVHKLTVASIIVD